MSTNAAYAPSRETISTAHEKFLALFEPSSMAIVGASTSPAKWGFRILYNTLCGEYKGKLYAVNPKHNEILGVPCFPNIATVPGPLDLALIVVPPPLVLDSVRECAQCGVRAVVVITAGFAEIGDDHARKIEKEIARVAQQAGMLLVGPNCAGVVSPSPQNLYGVMLHRYPQAGGVSVVSQSGNVGATALTWSPLHQVGIARLVGTGNEAATRSEDYLRFLAHDDKTKSIFLYTEGAADGRDFFNALRETAIEKPVVVVKGGRTEAGQKAAASHTGSLTSTTSLFEAACRQAGACVVEDIHQGLELAASFANQPLPRGRRVVIVSEGGGWGVLAADACAASGLNVINLPEDVLKELDSFLPRWWSRGNPVDLVAGNDRSLMSRAINTVLNSPEVDAVLVLGIGVVGYASNRSIPSRITQEAERFGLTDLAKASAEIELREVQGMAGLLNIYGKPIIVASDNALFAYGRIPNTTIIELERLGICAYTSPVNAANTLAHMVSRYEFLNSIPRRNGSAH